MIMVAKGYINLNPWFMVAKVGNSAILKEDILEAWAHTNSMIVMAGNLVNLDLFRTFEPLQGPTAANVRSQVEAETLDPWQTLVHQQGLVASAADIQVVIDPCTSCLKHMEYQAFKLIIHTKYQDHTIAGASGLDLLILQLLLPQGLQKIFELLSTVHSVIWLFSRQLPSYQFIQ